jgi:hypothetical protein
MAKEIELLKNMPISKGLIERRMALLEHTFSNKYNAKLLMDFIQNTH